MTIHTRVIESLIIAAMCAGVAGAQAAEVPDPPRAAWFALNGQASIFGETYGITGREPRRPGTTGRVVFQPMLEFTRFFKVGLDLQLTTEGNTGSSGAGSPALNAGRQRLNQLGISPTWSWGRVDLGDFTDSYTPHTFSGVRIRGAGAMLNPGIVRLATFRGQAQSAVLGEAVNTTYARSVTGGRVGLGREEGSFLDLILVRTLDDAGSLPPPDDTAFFDPRLQDPTVDPDTLPVGTLLNPLSVTPQENVVASAAGRLALFAGKLRFQGELSGAGYSRDVRASALDNEALLGEIPGFVRGLFTPRIGSSFGLAYTAASQFRIGRFAGHASYRRVDPGFVALGVASLLNDQTGWTLGGTRRFGRSTSLRMDVARQHDNLIGQKAFTTNRHNYGVGLTTRPVPRLSSSIRLQYVGMANDLASGDPQWIAYDNWMFTTNQTVSLSRDRLLRSVGLGYSYRDAGDANPSRNASSLTAHNATARAVFAPSAALSITPSIGVLRSSSAAMPGWQLRETYGLAAQLRAREGKSMSSLSLGSTEDRGIGAFQARFMTRYDLTDADVLTFSLRSSSYRNAPNPFGPPGGFHERTASLQLTRRLGGSNGS